MRDSEGPVHPLLTITIGRRTYVPISGRRETWLVHQEHCAGFLAHGRRRVDLVKQMRRGSLQRNKRGACYACFSFASATLVIFVRSALDPLVAPGDAASSAVLSPRQLLN